VYDLFLYALKALYIRERIPKYLPLIMQVPLENDVQA
jgi:hypothetical protein